MSNEAPVVSLALVVCISKPHGTKGCCRTICRKTKELISQSSLYPCVFLRSDTRLFFWLKTLFSNNTRTGCFSISWHPKSESHQIACNQTGCIFKAHSRIHRACTAARFIVLISEHTLFCLYQHTYSGKKSTARTHC